MSVPPVPDVSVVVPVFNEAGNVRPLTAEITDALGQRAVEIVFVDDGSEDGTAAEIAACIAADGRVRHVRHARRAGQSAAIVTGVRAARGAIVATLDGDGQNDPADLPGLLDALGDDPRLALVGGVRRGRRDTLVKRASSRIANGVRRRLLSDDAEDTGCGIKAFRRTAFLALPPFDHMHRFLPALFLAAGYQVRYRDVRHRPRRHGRSKYGLGDRLWIGLADLVGVLWLRRRLLPPTPVEEDAHGR
ncbi:MAG: glycosyltransferase family 2 protein [Alphaproteobacteria bacterium]|nr:glycosyltransferase family 2 protein [Alphaproteobacteria bacterium]